MNHAVMNDLQPGQRYFYVYGDEKLGRGKEHSFVTGPAPGAESSINVIATADMVLPCLSGPFSICQCVHCKVQFSCVHQTYWWPFGSSMPSTGLQIADHDVSSTFIWHNIKAVLHPGTC